MEIVAEVGSVASKKCRGQQGGTSERAPLLKGRDESVAIWLVSGPGRQTALHASDAHKSPITAQRNHHRETREGEQLVLCRIDSSLFNEVADGPGRVGCHRRERSLIGDGRGGGGVTVANGLGLLLADIFDRQVRFSGRSRVKGRTDTECIPESGKTSSSAQRGSVKPSAAAAL